MSGICITYVISYYIYIYVYYINFASINRTNKVLFNRKIINCDLIEVILNNSYRIKKNYAGQVSRRKTLDKSFYMYYIWHALLHIYGYYINCVSINQTNKGSYKSITNKRLKEISNQIWKKATESCPYTLLYIEWAFSTKDFPWESTLPTQFLVSFTSFY